MGMKGCSAFFAGLAGSIFAGAIGCGGAVDLGGKAPPEGTATGTVSSALCGSEARVLSQSAGAPGALAVNGDAVFWSIAKNSPVGGTSTSQGLNTSLYRLGKSDSAKPGLASGGIVGGMGIIHNAGEFVVAGDEAVFVQLDTKQTSAIRAASVGSGAPRSIVESEKLILEVGAGHGRLLWGEFTEWRAGDNVFSYVTMPLAGGPSRLLTTARTPLDIAILDRGFAWLEYGASSAGEAYRFVADPPSDARNFTGPAVWGRLAVHDERVYYRSDASTVASFDPASASLTTVVVLPPQLSVVTDADVRPVFEVDERNVYAADADAALFAVPRAGGDPIKVAEHVVDVAVDDACLYWMEVANGTTKVVSRQKP